MQADGHIAPPQASRVIGPSKVSPPAQSVLAPAPIENTVSDLGPVRLVPVWGKGPDAKAWRQLIDRHHYLGYTPLPGAQMRYQVLSRHGLVALLGFGAAAWKVEPRDQHIGWDRQQRQHNLHLIVTEPASSSGRGLLHNAHLATCGTRASCAA